MSCFNAGDHVLGDAWHMKPHGSGGIAVIMASAFSSGAHLGRSDTSLDMAWHGGLSAAT